MASYKTVTAVILMAFLVASSAVTIAEAGVTCGQVSSSLGGCITYLKGTGGAVPPACCAGVKRLASAASTTPDRQATCKCLKAAAGGISGLNYKLAAGLPSACSVSIPYKISPSTDCATVK